VRGTGSKMGEPCPKVRLSQDRFPILSFAQMLLRANVDEPIVVVKTVL
jgi:hypothetical protein